MDAIEQSYLINAPASLVWKALTDAKFIEKWSGAKAQMDDKKGSHFKLWGGDIYGTNKEVVPCKKLVQLWYEKGWAKPSLLTFSLSEKANSTTVKLTHKDVPKEELNDITKGWKDYYMNPLKEFVENS